MPAYSAAGQARSPATPAKPSQSAIPRQDGHPDLEGFWTNDTFTPLERPAKFRDKEFFTHEEAVAFIKDQNDRVLAQPKDNIHYDDAIWQTENYGKFENLRTSLIVEPRNGRSGHLDDAMVGRDDDSSHGRTAL